jgi:hypothetical protein
MMWCLAVWMALSARFGSFWLEDTSSICMVTRLRAEDLSSELLWLSLLALSRMTPFDLKNVTDFCNASAVWVPFNDVRGSIWMNEP